MALFRYCTRQYMVIHPDGGLCNRLRVVFSYVHIARKTNRHMVVVWVKNEECGGLFTEYFQPIPDVTFVESTHLSVDYEGGTIHPNYNENTDCIYSDLILLPTIAREIQKRKAILGEYIAVHVRRTDHTSLANSAESFTTDEEFVRFLGTHEGNMYIATDNKQTFSQFRTQFGNRIRIPYPNTFRDRLRETSLRDSIIDLYMCVHAKEFKGSGYSSFSKLIELLRKCSQTSVVVPSSLQSPYGS